MFIMLALLCLDPLSYTHYMDYCKQYNRGTDNKRKGFRDMVACMRQFNKLEREYWSVHIRIPSANADPLEGLDPDTIDNP